jgi:UDP-N-acetylglucosamine 2-epimerase (non-hydrolysing)
VLSSPGSILIAFGTRPEVIKMAPVVNQLRRQRDRVKTIVCTTGQHRELLESVLRTFDLVPDIDLDLMRPGQTLAGLSGAALAAIDSIHESTRPEAVLVQGDTTTAMSTALAAFYRRIPVGHVEAGLRTENLDRPFPEEMNRRVIGCLATWHFAPTRAAAAALQREGVPEDMIHVTGNTVIDALIEIAKRPAPAGVPPFPDPGRRLVLVTAHRRESFGEQFVQLCQAVKDIAAAAADIDLVYPVHLNPNVQEPVHRTLSGCRQIHLIPPLEYEAFVHLMRRATLILTDSGGIQEEAPALGVPVLVMREETERPEAVAAGVAKLVGTDRSRILNETLRLLTDETARQEMCKRASPFGDGRAAERIVQVLLDGVAFTAESAYWVG